MTRKASLRIVAACAALPLATSGVLAPPAHAEAAKSSVACVYEDHLVTSPSLSTEPQPYTTSSVDEGWIECTGTLGGHTLSGRGWFTQIGASSSGSLAYGTGGVDLVGALPILGGGELEFSGHFILTRVGAIGWGTGHINGEFAWTQYVAVPCSPAACTGPPGTTATVRGTGGTFSDGQVVAPAAPTGVAATVEGADVSVSWEPAPDEGVFPVSGYRIYREHVTAGEVGANATTFRDPSPGPGTYSYSVVAVNVLGIESEPSESVTVTIGQAARWEPEPSDPFNAPWQLKAETSGEAVSDVGLTWKRPRLKDVESYEVYSSRDELSPIAQVEGARHVDPDVEFRCGRSYTYYVAAVAADGTRAWSDPLLVGPFTESGEGC
jgi:hypothetical protein